ncbi:Eco57I restriction-modification methylase domain-containing protein [Furfurilactobacillus siliginis]|uniref:Restriction endonuclease n=1 Tax=Furfurilactobacillus siliginis TaxID=348151 RepID=A0A0R2LF03_9LACO|nr:Eco57I restriction-modification methylase domain-containing protein [Furfurilactobacillus siliginis]KRN97207.1 Eco57I restriction endonuclease [Furfurilactobacillus siliginis]GEK29320.1 restriction endonuclease [Furfurilactobacillus siliginis]
MESNFGFLMLDDDTQIMYNQAKSAEKLYASEQYAAELITIRKIAENVARSVLDFNFIEVPDHCSFNNCLKMLKEEKLIDDKKLIDIFYDLKRYGNDAAHTLDEFSREQALTKLKEMYYLLVWFSNSYMEQKISQSGFMEPQNDPPYDPNEKKLIYIQTGDNSNGMWPAYVGAEKVGDASVDNFEIDGKPNSDDLRGFADRRIKQYMRTGGTPYLLEWAELAYSKIEDKWFRDHDVHEVLERSGVKRSEHLDGTEWFKVDVKTAKDAIRAVKEGRSSLDITEKAVPHEIVLRPEQIKAVEQTRRVFQKEKDMLWNAKMRFGKTLSALQLIKEEKYKKVLIMTHRPVVSDSWFSDYHKMKMSKEGYRFGSKNKGETIDELNASEFPYIYFASIQDLRGSKRFGGKVADKNELIADIDWDLIIIDEAHEGTQTDLAHNVLSGIKKDKTRLLELSGTPFNLLDQYKNEDQVYTWDYVMEQKAKQRWPIDHPNEANPYETLPSVSMYTFEMQNRKEFSDESKSFNFKEFFRVDDATGKFVYEKNVKQFLDNITHQNGKTNYPFSTLKFRNALRHTLWLLPGVKEAKALKELMEEHPVFGTEYKVINVVADGDSDLAVDAGDSDLERVRKAITNEPSKTKTITLTVRKLTTGVNVKEWTGIVFLSNMTSAMQYLQAAFRAQTPFSDEKMGMKKRCYIFDFAPDRALSVMAESNSFNSGAGKLVNKEQKDSMAQLLNFLPIIGETKQGMQEYNIDKLLTTLKKVYAEKAVRSGFDDDSLYSDELLKINTEDLVDFNGLKAIVGTTKADRKPTKVDVNNQGLTDEEYDRANRGEAKPKKDRIPEEQAVIDKKNALKKQKRTMISILRSISIRIPMMIYGMDIDIEEDVSINDFLNLVDEKSWNEFMPKGVTKGEFSKFIKYYDPQIFIEAGRIIRKRVKALDKLDPIERTEEIAAIFGTFKNPDKETVLTPWRVVNMQLGMTIGGLSYFDDKYEVSTVEAKSALHWVQNKSTDTIFKNNTKILEINSKTGLYPLYAATSLYQRAINKLNEIMGGKFTAEDEWRLWENILKANIFVVAKTPMAKTIAERTLAGYRHVDMNIEFIDGIVDAARISPDDGVKKIKAAFGIMKFDVVIGNPPYQEEAGGSSSSDKPIYHLFMEMAYELADKSVLITPGRFLFRAGATPSAWNEKMLNDTHLKVVMYEQNGNKIFPRTDIKGGIAITVRDVNENFGAIGTFTAYPELNSILSKVNPFLRKDGNLTDIIFSQNKLNLEELFSDYPQAKDSISSNGRDRRLESNIFVKLEAFHDFKVNEDDIKILGLIDNKRTYRFINKKYIDLTHANLYDFKVLLPKSNGSGALGEVVSTPLVGTPLVGYTRTFLGIGSFSNELEANNALKYIKSKFARTMLGILKVTQDNNPDKWIKVPLQDFSISSDIDWSESTDNVDAQLYRKYKLSDAEIRFIETKVQEMN